MISAHPILSIDDSIALEHELLGNDTKKTKSALDRAGRMLGQAIMRDYREIEDFPENPHIGLILGKGHNAGDALIALAEIARFAPYSTMHILECFPPDSLKPLVAEAYTSLQNIVKVISYPADKVDSFCNLKLNICIDGLFGMQFKAPIDDSLKSVLNSVNEMQNISMRVAVDLPSAFIFNADITYATGIAKEPIFEHSHQDRVGRIRYLDIGFFDSPNLFNTKCTHSEYPYQSSILHPDILKQLRRLRKTHTDKRHYGHLFILGGSETMPGALTMATRSAIRSGVGRVTVFAPEMHQPQLLAQAPEAMSIPYPVSPEGGCSLEGIREILNRCDQATALLIGPGMGNSLETKALISELIAESDLPLILDADALHDGTAIALSKRNQRNPDAGPVCLTPHFGEWKKLNHTSDISSQEIRTKANEWNAHILLKHANTLISDGTHDYINTFGNPVLARGGSGDVLAGLLSGLIAFKPDKPLEMLCLSAVWHACAADALARNKGQHSASALDVLDYLPAVIRDYEV